METGLGCWEFGPSFGFWENQDIPTSKKTLRVALKSGIHHIDTAQGYGNGLSEQLVGSVLQAFPRNQVFLSSKVMNLTDLKQSLERSLSRLKTEYLDLLYLHYPKAGVDYQKVFEELETLKDSGVIHNIGLSNFSTSQIESLCKAYDISYIQRPFSLLWTRELEEQLSLCHSLGLRICGYSPLGLGLLTGKYRSSEDLEDSRKDMYCFSDNSRKAFSNLLGGIGEMGDNIGVCYAWVKAKNPDVMLIGARNEVQLKEDLSQIDRIVLSQEQIDELDHLSRLLEKTAPKEAGNLFLHNA